MKGIWQVAGGYATMAILTIVSLVVLAGVLPSRLTIEPAANDVGTIAQIVPATVVAIFVFGLGAVFVIAQMVVPSRGSRAIGVLFSDGRVQAVVTGGLVLLGASLVVAAGETSWRADLAGGLLVATGMYIIIATGLIVWVFLEQISPRAFKDRLIKRPRVPGLPIRRERSTSEDLYVTLRVFRGWLRTVNRIGESRDLQFGVEGMLELVQQYTKEVREQGDTSRLCRPPADYTEAQNSPVTHDRPPCSEATSWPPLGSAGKFDEPAPWFASELGRALTRAVESGVRGNTLRRDLDRLLNLFDLAIREFAPCDENGRELLEAQATVLVRHLAEVGMGVRHCEDWQQEWFLGPILRLARLTTYFEHVGGSSLHRAPAAGRLARTALCAWLVAGEAFVSSLPEDKREQERARFIARCAPLLGTCAETWVQPSFAEVATVEPAWALTLTPRRDAVMELFEDAYKCVASRQRSVETPRVGDDRRPGPAPGAAPTQADEYDRRGPAADVRSDSKPLLDGPSTSVGREDDDVQAQCSATIAPTGER
jgi:hypothetical protein